jgi:hypothetical protein
VPKDTQMTISFLDELTMFLEDPQHSRDNHGSSSKKIVRKDFVVQSDEDEDEIFEDEDDDFDDDDEFDDEDELEDEEFEDEDFDDEDLDDDDFDDDDFDDDDEDDFEAIESDEDEDY